MNILVVDDCEKLGRVFQHVLSEEGHGIDCVLNGYDALNKIQNKQYDIIFLDIIMPEMDGIATLRQIRQFNTKVKIIMMAGYSMDEVLNKTNEYNVHSILYKPISIHIILSVLD